MAEEIEAVVEETKADPTDIPLEDEFAYLSAPRDEFDVAPKPKPVEKPTEPAPKVDVKPAHPASLVAAAREWGIGDRQIAALDTESLTELVFSFQRKSVERENALLESRRRQRPEAPIVPSQERDEAEEELKSLEAEFDPKLLAPHRRQAKEIKELKQALQQQAERDALRRKEEVSAAVEDAIEHLGEDYSAIYGKGSLLSIDDDSKEQRFATYRAAGIQWEVDSPRAAAAKFAAQAKKSYGKLLAKKPEVEAPVKPTNGNGEKRYTAEEWKQAALGRPTNALPTRLKSDKAAASAINDLMLKQREGATDIGGNDFSGIPD